MRGNPTQLAALLDDGLRDPYAGFSFRRDALEDLPSRPQVKKTRVQVSFARRSLTTLLLEIAPPDTGDEEFTEISAVDLVITSACGSGSAKKSPDATDTRSLTPAAAIAFPATGATGGRSKLVQRRCGCRAARTVDNWPVAPPASQTASQREKSTFSASAWQLPAEIPARIGIQGVYRLLGTKLYALAGTISSWRSIRSFGIVRSTIRRRSWGWRRSAIRSRWR